MGSRRGLSRRWQARGLALGVTVALTGAAALTGTVTLASRAAAATIAFGKSALTGATLSGHPTSLQFGPDGRLYVLQGDGTVNIFTVARNAANAYAVTATETVGLVKDIPNHDDDGTVNATLGRRQATGLVVTGTASSPILYVSSSDPRYGGGSRGDLNLDTNSGVVSRLTRSDTGWAMTELVRGLPRSEENHSINGMALDSTTNTLYLAAGGHTNMGAPSGVFAYLPEYALSAAILSIDLDAIGDTTYDLPTLDDPARAGVNDAYDPFGGNDGANQAVISPGGPVQVYSPGYRNPYDLLISSQGLMYSDDNGHNAGQGNVPVGEGPNGVCTNAVSEPGVTGPDSLHLVTAGYYAGHPNPTRANTANTFNGQSPIVSANPIECDYQAAAVGGSVLDTDPSSSNGITEYTASNFAGTMQGDLLLAAYDNYITRVDLDDTGRASLGSSTLFSTVGNHPLDVVAMSDTDAFPGTVWVADHGTDKVYVFEPSDYGGPPPSCTGAYDAGLDEDSDGFDNADEIDNANDPCSAGDRPHDWDGDLTSDLNDPDDDNDGLPDTSDPFAIDGANGLASSLPLVYTFDEATADADSLLGLGFTGLMTNRVDNYRDLYDPQQLTAGGAPGVLTVDALPSGDTTSNDLGYGFQFGVRTDTSTGSFVARTRLVSPFAGTTPTGSQSMGLAIGPGNQDAYLKLVLTANNGAPGVRAVKEVAGSVTSYPVTPLTLPGPATVDLFLRVDPAAASVQPMMAVGTGKKKAVGSAIPIPIGWVDGRAAVAVGVVGSSSGGGQLSATWDMLEARQVTRPDATVKRAGDPSSLGDNVYNTTGANQTRATTVNRGSSQTYIMRLFNDGSQADAFAVQGSGGADGFTVRYLKGASGTTDITSGVLAGTYSTANILSGGSVIIRLVVSVGTNVSPGTVRSWLLSATSKRDPTVSDAVAARVTAK